MSSNVASQQWSPESQPFTNSFKHRQYKANLLWYYEVPMMKIVHSMSTTYVAHEKQVVNSKVYDDGP